MSNGAESTGVVECNTQLDQSHARKRVITLPSSSRPVQNQELRRVNSEPTVQPPRRFSLASAKVVMFQPLRPVGPAPGFFQSLLAIVTSSWLNLMLVFIPVSWILHFILPASHANKDTLLFVSSFLAIIPLTKLLAFATDELSIRVGQALAGLINATLGNTVKLIVAIIALAKCEISLVQSSCTIQLPLVVGSMLNNILLTLGVCIFAGGLKFFEQGFGLSHPHAWEPDSIPSTLANRH